MHEWALAEAVMSTASRIAEQEGLKRISEVDVRIGELQQIDLEAFRLALSEIARQVSEEIRFNIEFEKAEFRCRVCGNRWPFESEKLNADAKEAIHVIPEVAHVFIKCPRCGSPDFEVIRGRGVWVEGVKGER